MLLASVIEAFRSLFKINTYGSELESYIVSHNPKNACDVEYLTRRYEYVKTQERFL